MTEIETTLTLAAIAAVLTLSAAHVLGQEADHA